MKAVVDDKIPFIEAPLRELMDEVKFLPGSQIAAEDVRDADVLIVRTRTRCDRALLEGSKVRLVATATIGYDHLDLDYLHSAGIAWANCPGCNATSVAQYVRNSLLLWCRENEVETEKLTVGIVGVGHVGRAVCEALVPLGCHLLLNDPPRQEAEDNLLPNGDHIEWASLKALQERCNVITLHVPLTYAGAHATHHLVDEAFLQGFKQRPLLINAARGGVVDDEAAERALDEGRICQAVIDTWEAEPNIRRSLLEKVFLGTPHIAGYSADGKANATRMTLESVCKWMGKEMSFDIQPPALPAHMQLPNDPWERALALYNPADDSQRLKNCPDSFEKLRGNYPLRREKA